MKKKCKTKDCNTHIDNQFLYCSFECACYDGVFSVNNFSPVEDAVSKLNSKSVSTGVSAATIGKTINEAGGKSFELNDKNKLVTGVLTCFFNEPKYYGDTSADLVLLIKKIAGEDPEFVAKLACYARNVFHMRTISHVLAAEVAFAGKGKTVVRKMINKVIERPDDMCNIISYYLDNYGKPITRSLRRGLADVFPSFDEYRLAKYKGIDDKVKLRDVLKLVRPKPNNDEQALIWKKLIENTLEVPETRETVLSEKGQSKEVWESLIDNKSLGYMATLRNLKNIINNNVSSEHVKKVCSFLTNEKAVLGSKQLPFRFLSAYREVEMECSGSKTGNVLDSISKALSFSVSNLPSLKGITFMTADQSGSMSTFISEKSKVSMRDIGNLLMSVAHRFCEESIISAFGESFKVINLSKENGIFANIKSIADSRVGHSTNTWKAIDYLLNNKIKVDRIVIFSDMQCYGDKDIQNLINKYRSTINKDVWIHSIDLQGYGTTPVIGQKVNLIAGWSDKVLDFISMSEKMDGSLLDSINSYQI